MYFRFRKQVNSWLSPGRAGFTLEGQARAEPGLVSRSPTDDNCSSGFEVGWEPVEETEKQLPDFVLISIFFTVFGNPSFHVLLMNDFRLCNKHGLRVYLPRPGTDHLSQRRLGDKP